MSASQNDICVLVVEDDPMVQKVTEGFLEKIGNVTRIQSISTVAEAKNVLRKDSVDCVLLDLFFPESSGLDLLRWIRTNEIEAEVILITADHRSETIRKSMHLGAVDYLVKPFRFPRFEQAIERVKVRKRTLMDAAKPAQEDIDRMIQMGEPELSSEDDHNATYHRIERFLSDHADTAFTAKMLGDELGITRITARRYLDAMEKEGKVSIQLEYGSVGRPQNFYRMRGDFDDEPNSLF